MAEYCSPLAALCGRILLSAIFLLSAFGKMMDWSGTAAGMEKHGMVAVPFFLAGAIALELGGGLSVLLGLKARWGAVALLVFIVPATLIFHNFWAEDGAARMNQMTNFMKNIAIMGGLLTVVAHGAGGFSIDNWRHSRSEARPTARRSIEPAEAGVP
ncbi:MAG TPA: DoxX family protein [Gemmataceae bacterium]|nr:DoxX family protein [Gemmataceae bacterium]